MNEFLSRAERVTIPAAPAQVRRGSVRSVQAAAASGQTGGGGGGRARRDHEDSQYSSAAELARANKTISDVLTDLRGADGNVADADAAINALLPKPAVPPISREQMDHAAAVASALRQDVPLARKAQAHVPTGTAEAVIT